MATIKPKKNYTTIITVNNIVSSFYNCNDQSNSNLVYLSFCTFITAACAYHVQYIFSALLWTTI